MRLRTHHVSNMSFFQQVYAILTNNWQSFIYGTVITLFISLVATFFGFILALLIAIGRQNKLFDKFASAYITLFRGTPMMVQGMVIYYGISYSIAGFRWSNLPGGNIVAGLLIVSLNTSAYLAETIRGGIQSLDKGQFEAAKSLGFSRWQTMQTIILPQAIRNVIPAIGNEIIVNIKDTSVLNIIPVTELFFISQGIASSTLRVAQTFTITSAIYLFLTTILTAVLRQVELKLDRTKTLPSNYMASVSSSHTDSRRVL